MPGRTSILILAIGALFAPSLLSQGVPDGAPALSRIEPGLETAVKWVWKAVPSDPKDWGLALPEPSPTPPPMGLPAPEIPAGAPNSYEVKKGDALFTIGRRVGVSVEHLKKANDLKTDVIRIGQVLRIPTPEEIALMSPPPRPAAPGAPAPVAQVPGLPAGTDPEVLLFKIFLDRHQLSPGPIDGQTSLEFQKLMFLLQNTNEEFRDLEVLRQKARAEVGNPITTYTLRTEDFRYIAPPRAERVIPGATPTPTPARKKNQPAAAPTPAPPVYEEMIATPMLAYRSPWEFVAERFHVSEAFLRALNPELKGVPAAGAEFRVPNVIPFEIEKAFTSPLRPAADPANPISAVIIDRTRLEIYRNDRLIAVFPVSSARPALRGRGTWTILDAIPRPRLETRQEPREKPRATSSFFVGENAAPSPTPAMLADPQFLPPGPNNPVGIFWINLAKADSPDPLPFGLHGTSIPDRMNVTESIGGFRLTNWDIARAVRLLPSGTPLRWQQSSVPTSAPAAVPL